MEDDNGLELSLGLSCGGSASKTKGKEGCSSDCKQDEGGSSCKSIGDLKNFFNMGTEKQDSANGPSKNDPAPMRMQTSQENFLTILEKSNEGDSSADLEGNKVPQLTMYGSFWDANYGRSPVEEKSESHETGASNKRKILIEEMNKKHERESKQADRHNKNLSTCVSTSTKTSHISFTTEDGSIAENEDVVESEAEGLSSRMASNLGDGTKRYKGGPLEALEESNTFYNSSVKNIKAQKQSNVPTANESKQGRTFNYGMPISFTPDMNVPFSISGNVPNAPGAIGTSGFPVPCTMQMIHPANNEQPGTQSINPGYLPSTFGYLPGQLPMLDTGNSWNFSSHPQQFPSSYAGCVGLSSHKSEYELKISQAATQALPHGSSSETLPESEIAKGEGKQLARQDSSVEGFSHEGSVIIPGMAPGLKFGGCGSYPDLPWVSTTGPNADSRMISGVTYRYDKNQMRIVCACHGTHMSPEEFVLHASAEC